VYRCEQRRPGTPHCSIGWLCASAGCRSLTIKNQKSKIKNSPALVVEATRLRKCHQPAGRGRGRGERFFPDARLGAPNCFFLRSKNSRRKRFGQGGRRFGSNAALRNRGA